MKLDFKAAINRLLLTYTVLAPLTFMLLQGPIWWKDRDLRIREQVIKETEQAIKEAELEERNAERALREIIANLEFKDILEYHSIFPVERVVNYGEKARFVSDSVVHPIIESIPGGVRVDWYETILCDMNPHDDVVDYSFYKEAETTGFNYTVAVPRKPAFSIQYSDGWPVNLRGARDENGNQIPVVYPMKPANCRLRSQMIMRIDGIDGVPNKSKVRYSEHVEVRDLSE